MKIKIVALGLVAILGMVHSQQCGPGEFQCANGPCVYASWICDGFDDCGDGSDEQDEQGNCPDCPAASYKCETTGRCLDPSAVCNGANDCGDWSDETELACPCSDDELRCARQSEDGPPGPCIPPEWICDEEGIWDCPLGDDEANCTVRVVGTKHAESRHVRPTPLKKTKKAKKSGLSMKAKQSKKLSWYQKKKCTGNH